MDHETLPLTSERLSSDQIDLLRQQDDHQYQYSLEVLKAQERDREASRANLRALHERSSKMKLWTTGIAAVFLLAALWLGKDQFLLESLKYLVLIFGGGGVGYMYGYKKGSNRQNQ